MSVGVDVGDGRLFDVYRCTRLRRGVKARLASVSLARMGMSSRAVSSFNTIISCHYPVDGLPTHAQCSSS